MSALSIIVGVILPPVTFVVFMAAMLNRFWTWKKLPQPGMTLFPTSPNGTAAGVLKETLFFPSLFRSDRFLWAVSWLFHAMLALIFISLPDPALVAAGILLVLPAILLLSRGERRWSETEQRLF